MSEPTITFKVPREIDGRGLVMALQYLMLAADFCVQPETEPVFREFRAGRGDPLDEGSDLTGTLIQASIVATALATVHRGQPYLTSLVCDLTNHELGVLAGKMIAAGAREVPHDDGR